METIPLSSTAPCAAGIAVAARQPAPDDEIPLGWECANPVLQIERWGLDEEGSLSGNS